MGSLYLAQFIHAQDEALSDDHSSQTHSGSEINVLDRLKTLTAAIEANETYAVSLIHQDWYIA